MANVSAKAIETAKPKTKTYSIAIGDGLVLLVNPNGSKWWRFRYRYNGTAKMLSLGVYPDISLARRAVSGQPEPADCL